MIVTSYRLAQGTNNYIDYTMEFNEGQGLRADLGSKTNQQSRIRDNLLEGMAQQIGCDALIRMAVDKTQRGREGGQGSITVAL